MEVRFYFHPLGCVHSERLLSEHGLWKVSFNRITSLGQHRRQVWNSGFAGICPRNYNSNRNNWIRCWGRNHPCNSFGIQVRQAQKRWWEPWELLFTQIYQKETPWRSHDSLPWVQLNFCAQQMWGYFAKVRRAPMRTVSFRKVQW